MARLIKSNSVDDGQFPLPPDQRALAAARAGHGTGPQSAFDGVEPAELQHALSELREMVGMISGMRPAVAALAETVVAGGRDQGYRDGVAQAQGEVQGQLIEAISALTAAGEERYRLSQQHEPALADLALQIARKVIGEHLVVDPSLVTGIVRDAINDLEPSTSLYVHLHPDDVPIVAGSRTELERLVRGTGEIELVADETVDRGGVVLRSPVGDVDARIATKLSVLETAFTAQRRQLVDEAGNPTS